MKTIVYVLFAFLLATAAANAQGISTLSIANLNVNPTPLVAGDHASITLQLYNSYQAELSDVNLRLEGSYPLLNFSPAQTYIISNIGGDGLYGGENTYFTFNFSVPADTPSGVYTLDLVATYQTTTTTTSGGASYTQTQVGESEMPITVYVHGVPNVTASIVESTPVLPGEQSSGEIELQNIGGGAAKNITVHIYNTSGIGIVGSSTFNIGKLPSTATATLPFVFQANQHIANGTYVFPLQISYESNLNNTYKKTLDGSINVVVNQPQIVVSPVGAIPQTLMSGYNQSLEFAIENNGYGPAKNISVSFYSGNGISMLGSVHSFFIGTLPQSGTATESVFIAANNTYSNETGFVRAEVTYYSANMGKVYTANFTVPVYLQPSAQFEIVNESSDIVPGATDVPITYFIKNTGNIVADNVQVSMQSIYPITPIDSDAYLASIAPGKTESVTFLVSADSNGVPGSYPVIVYETWKQPNGAPNQEYSGSNNYMITINSGSGTSASAQYTYEAVIVIAVVAIFAFGFRVRRSRKTKRQHG